MKRTNNLFLVILCLIILSLVGCSKNEEANAQQVAKDFITDLYTVSNEEVENYESLTNISPEEATEMDWQSALQINDDILKSLMTDNGYELLMKNRDNLRFTEICHGANYTMQVAEIILSENNADIDNNEADYSFEVKLTLISDDGKETEATAEGRVFLNETYDNWKVTEYRQGQLSDALSKLIV